MTDDEIEQLSREELLDAIRALPDSSDVGEVVEAEALTPPLEPPAEPELENVLIEKTEPDDPDRCVAVMRDQAGRCRQRVSPFAVELAGQRLCGLHYHAAIRRGDYANPADVNRLREVRLRVTKQRNNDDGGGK